MVADIPKVFQDVRYFLANENDAIKQILKDGAGQREYYITDLVNYVISDSCDFAQYTQAKESKIPVVSTGWVHMCVKCENLLPPLPFSISQDGLFDSVTACLSQIPVVDRDPLLAMLVYYNGKYQINLNANCTHLVCGKPAGRKYEYAVKHQIKVVTPEWISDSISSNLLLPENEYELIVTVSPSRLPLKPFNSQGNFASIVADVSPSTFMTLVTPGQTAVTTSRDNANTSIGFCDNKENTISVNEIKLQEKSDLLKDFVLFFTDYEERLSTDTFSIWKEVIENAHGLISPVYADDVTHVICLHQQSTIFKKALLQKKLIATAYWLNDVLVSKKVFAPRTPLHLPVPFTEIIPGLKNALITVSGYEGRERAIVKHMINFLGASYTGHMTRAHTHLVCKTLSGEKYKKAVEWGITVVSPKWLGDMIQTGQSFPCKAKTKYSIISNGDNLKINSTFSTYLTNTWDEATNQNDESLEPKNKQQKIDIDSVNVKRVLFTGLTGATVHRLRQNVVKLKGELAKGVNDCTHLVAPKITRTVKFLSAVSVCKFLVAPSWVDESFEGKSFLDETNYTLVDPESEELFGFKLKRSLQRAQTRQVCKGLHFHVTPSILPAPNAMKEIIECAGGKMTEVKTIEEVKDIFIMNVEKDFSYNSYLVSCLDDKKLWNDIVKDGYDVYNVELILSGVMKQELEWNLHHL